MRSKTARKCSKRAQVMAERDEGSGNGAAMASDAVAAGELACDELEVGGRRAGEGGRTAGLDGLGP